MKVVAALLALIGSTAAFAPAAKEAVGTSLNVESTEIGATAPLGFFDPLGYITDEAKFERYRAVERKHGRIAMMAMLGTFVHNNNWVFDGYLSPSQGIKFSDIDTGIGGLFQVPPQGLAQILIVSGLIELAWWPASQLDGDYGVRLGKINNWEQEPAKELRQKNAELNNGRAAMMGTLGILLQEVVTGQNLQEQFSSLNITPY
mmetsp:Transcript_16993/g.25723  ORF Transcript_16993/g.25723 Transcript_16993/m.25723 type:complete len:203 (-) Transcript_16993:206-814(-)|eukprot:CAMPEP_0178912312 /NCGR_PEP_ID=MMETSP0786-20121207/10192_1 /TAXON_ID=186022 /ORGANISM="Thalassionema frauenfeldii, Strain CCMP 1798" /LENGTH=202 /DNA_ID=CAMNT_0020584879 /DNA_START=117 /DNA_END=725 /DNA_ORIENTATION=+